MLAGSRHLRTATLTAALAAGLALAACGGGSSDDDASPAEDRRQARAAVERLYDAIADGDAARVCAQLNDRARRQLARGGLGQEASTCAESFQAFLDEAEKAGGLNLTLKAKVRRVRVEGDTAVAKVTFGKGVAGDVPLEKVDGEWKLEAAGATPQQ